MAKVVATVQQPPGPPWGTRENGAPHSFKATSIRYREHGVSVEGRWDFWSKRADAKVFIPYTSIDYITVG